MKLFKFTALAFLVLSYGTALNAQSNTTSFSFKKGEVLDILILTLKPEAEALFETYKKTAFPVAIKLGYKPMPGFRIAENIQGNIEPHNFIFGKWTNLKNREQFLTDIETAVPDFHKQRRALWSIFNLTYYEMQKDISFKINKDKYNVATAYWQKDKALFAKFKKEFSQKSNKSGGKAILELTDGKSPFGYHYQPDYMVITQWENKAAFDVFYRENLKMNKAGVQHVNQFVIN